MSQRAHSDLGASGMHRWMKCPGSYRVARSSGRRRSSVYAATGTLAHEIIESYVGDYVGLKQGRQVPPDFIGKTFTIEGHDITVDADFVDGVNTMLAYLTQVVPGYGFIRAEMRVSLDHWLRKQGVTAPEPMFATADVVMLDPFGYRLELVDYKNGAGIFVSIMDNPQLLYYAAGVWCFIVEHHPKVRIDKVRITVVQPHASGQDKIRSQDIDLVDLMMWMDETLVPAVEACADPDAPLVPGPWCRFCPAAQACPALMADAVAMAKKDFADHMLPATNDELAEQLVIAERAVLWAEALRTYALEQLQKQERIPGWGLEPTRPARRWINETEVRDRLEKMGLPEDATHKRELLSPAALEKTMRKGSRGDFWTNMLAPLVESRSSGVKLVRTDTSDPTQDFDDDPLGLGA